MVKREFEALQLTLSENIRRLRRQQGLSQERLALEAGVDRTLVSKIERVIANPTLEILVKLAVILDVPVSRLLKD
ncbi:MAG: XRE family transcriptional regulator [Betaproteobacteria bacterium]|jgi:transcriptional regulator with XRE-family HTH domain|nr:XRE family transcriptional regulator [Betaproteobacteria bacterium]